MVTSGAREARSRGRGEAPGRKAEEAAVRLGQIPRNSVISRTLLGPRSPAGEYTGPGAPGGLSTQALPTAPAPAPLPPSSSPSGEVCTFRLDR